MAGHLVCFLAAGLTAVRFTAIRGLACRVSLFVAGNARNRQKNRVRAARTVSEEPGQAVEEPIIPRNLSRLTYDDSATGISSVVRLLVNCFHNCLSDDRSAN